MKKQWFLFLVILCNTLYSQQTQLEYRKVLTSNLNLPIAQFYTLKNNTETSGSLSAFSSIGLGLSFNYGKASFSLTKPNSDKDSFVVDQENIKFSNIVGIQAGILYSADISETSTKSSFAAYGGLNILDIQIGGGYEFGNKTINQTGWFVSVSYGIPLTKLGSNSSIMFKKRKKSMPSNPNSVNRATRKSFVF